MNFRIHVHDSDLLTLPQTVSRFQIGIGISPSDASCEVAVSLLSALTR